MKTCFSTNIHDITEVIGNQLSPIRSRSNKNVSKIQIKKNFRTLKHVLRLRLVLRCITLMVNYKVLVQD